MSNKKKEVKGMNIGIDVHKMLKLQSLLTGENMTDIAERAILNIITDEVKGLVSADSLMINTILSNSSKKNNNSEKEKEKKEEVLEKEKKESVIYEETEEEIFDNNSDIESIDPEIACYM